MTVCYYAFAMYLHYFACVHDDGATMHDIIEKNTIKGGSSFLFTIGNTDFELNTSVILSASGSTLFSWVFTSTVYIYMYIEVYRNILI